MIAEPWWITLFWWIGIVVTAAWFAVLGLILRDELNERRKHRNIAWAMRVVREELGLDTAPADLTNAAPRRGHHRVGGAAAKKAPPNHTGGTR